MGDQAFENQADQPHVREAAHANPYLPSQVELVPMPDDSDVELTSHAHRFTAAIIDILIFVFVAALLSSAFDQAGYTQQLRAQYSPLLRTYPSALAILPFFATYALHAYTLFRYGQTIGKKFCGIRIANLDDSVPNILKIVFVRQLPVLIVLYMPSRLGIVLCAIDVLFMFRADRRCIHDFIARTKVVEVI